jgi:Ca-activated chloride channel family protein
MFRVEDISYLLYLLALPIMGVLFYFLMQWRKANIRKLGDSHLVERLFPSYSKYKVWFKYVLYLLALGFVIVALANPQFGGRKEKVEAKSTDVFVALDISNSMLTEDISPSRLERAKRFTSRLIRSIRGERIGLILFAGNAYLQMPLTQDYAASELFVSAASTAQAGTQGTSFANAINMSIDAFEPGQDNQKALIIISDGEDHEEEALDAASKAKGENIVIYTIAVGTEDGGYIPIKNRGREEYKLDENGQPVISKVNYEIMADIAQQADGKFYNIDQENSVLKDIKTQINRLQKKEVEQESFTDFTSYFQYLLFFGIILLILDLFLTENKGKKKLV